MVKIICIGSASKDIFFPTDKGVVYDTPEDITSQRKIAFELGAKYQVNQRHESLGGCAANVSKGLALLGISVECCTKIGNDVAGDWIEQKLSEGKIGLKPLQKENCKSDLSMIIVDEDSGERTIFSDRDANEKLEIIPEKLEDADWIFVSSLNGAWQENLKKISNLALEKKIYLAFNPGQKNIATGVLAVLDFIKHTDVLMLNKDEALEILLGANIGASAEDLEDEIFLLKTLKEMGPKVVLITDGVRGAWARGESGTFHAEALIVKALDTTGAGDAFTSGFLAALLKNKSLEESLKWGVVNSQSSVRKYGGQDGLLNEEEIVKLSEEVVVL